jgi:hypothetical protein
MKRALLFCGLFCLGFLTKLAIGEAERLMAVGYADQCIASRTPKSPAPHAGEAQESRASQLLSPEDRYECFTIARTYTMYRVVDTLNAQPNFWMQ